MSDDGIGTISGRAGAATRSAALVAAGLLAFALGALVYVVDRDASRVAAMPAAWSLCCAGSFGAAGGWLPSFAHVFAFAVFTAALLAQPRWRYGACAAWCAVDVAFEAAQHPALAAPLARALSGDALSWPPARVLASYLARGTWDAADVAAAVGGALAAAAAIGVAQSFGVAKSSGGESP